MVPTETDYSAFQIPLGQHLMSQLVHGNRWFWRGLGNLESAVLRDRIEQVEVRRPIYIAGLARAGSTILLEILASHRGVVTHQYRDFWNIFTPFWSEKKFFESRQSHRQPIERSHGDGLMVTPNSPEAIEEILWMSFFENLHEPNVSNVMTKQTDNPQFARFYLDHIRKLLLARRGKRYASKGNYNTTRLEYLLKLFPDAQFIVPIRHPREHVASLCKQHVLLSNAADAHPRSLTYLNQVGHFEFGANRRPINAGDTEELQQIQMLWTTGENVRGWARYWSHIYGYLANRLEENAQLRQAVKIVRYEDLCTEPERTLRQLLNTCELPDPEIIIDQFSDRLRPPSYYQPQFTEKEEDAIAEETADVAQAYEYERPPKPPQISSPSQVLEHSSRL